MKFSGLEHQQKQQLRKLPAHQVDRALVQAVVSPHSPLIHQTAREARFRHTYGAALLSVHRAGEPITGDVADVKLQSGDVLVLEAGPEFHNAFAHSPAFALISKVRRRPRALALPAAPPVKPPGQTALPAPTPPHRCLPSPSAPSPSPILPPRSPTPPPLRRTACGSRCSSWPPS
jgi:hypothetical protein